MAEALSVGAEVSAFTGRDVTVGEIERELARLRRESASADGSQLRTSVMTHIAWLPPEWVDPAHEVLAGLAERHPSRTILLLPEPDAESGLDAELSLRCFPLRERHGQVCSEVIELTLRGDRVRAPASIVTPLLISDLPAFLRWRGQPQFEEPAFTQLIGVVDRLVVDSREWADLPNAYRSLTTVFERAAVSDIAWARGLPWRHQLALLWPDVAEVRELSVAGPYADALLLAGWLRSRLGRDVELVHAESDEELAEVAVDGEPVTPTRGDERSASDLLSDELDRFSRDAVYEDAVAAAVQ